MLKHQITLHWPIVEFREPQINKKIIIILPSVYERKLSETLKWTKILNTFKHNLSKSASNVLKKNFK